MAQGAVFSQSVLQDILQGLCSLSLSDITQLFARWQPDTVKLQNSLNSFKETDNLELL